MADARAPPPENDIMQMARVGDVAGIEKLFESGEYDATYSDDEGITPMHVRCLSAAFRSRFRYPEITPQHSSIVPPSYCPMHLTSSRPFLLTAS